MNISVADNYTICFHSQHVEGILIDSYEVTIVDVTKEVLYLENHTIVDDNVLQGGDHLHASSSGGGLMTMR